MTAICVCRPSSALPGKKVTVLTPITSPAITGITANQPLRKPRVAGAKDGPGRLLNKAGGVVDERLADGGNQRFVSEDGANFLFGMYMD